MPSIPSGVIDFFIHPPWGVLQLEHIAGAPFFTGQYALDRPRGPVRVDAYGLLWSVTTEAPGVGLTPGLVTEYDERVIEISLTYQLLDGTFIQGARLASSWDNGQFMFDQLLPYGVDVRIGVPFSVDLWWLLAF